MAWLDSPIIGNGLDNHTYVIRYMSSFRSNNLGFSNSITSVMARGGLVYLFAYLLPLGMLVKNGSKDEKLGMAIYFLLWCVTIVTEIPINIYIFSFALVRGLENRHPTGISQPKHMETIHD